MKLRLPLVLIFCAILGYLFHPILFDYLNGAPSAEQSTAVAPTLRELPSPQPAPPEASVLKPIFAGGGPTSLSNALKGSFTQEPNEELPWVPVSAAPFQQGRSLGETSFFFVLKPNPSEKSRLGLLGNSHRNYDNFVVLDQLNKDSFRLWTEDKKGRGHNANLVSEAILPSPGEPRLIELHPLPNNRLQVLINGYLCNDISSEIQANIFGGGYSGHHYSGHVGEIHAYALLNEAEKRAIRTRLTDWWDLKVNESSLAESAPFHKPHRFAPRTLITDSKKPTSVTSDQLTLTIPPTEEPTTLAISASNQGPVTIQGLPPSATLRLGQTWRLENHSYSGPLTFSFPQASTLPADYLSENGFYALLHRSSPSDEWREIASSSATDDAKIHFTLKSLSSGELSLAIIQGTSITENPSRILAVSDDPSSLRPGLPVTLKTEDTPENQEVTLTDTETGLIWYQGSAKDLNLTYTPLRRSTIELRATFSPTASTLGSEQSLTFRLKDTVPKLYPGVRVEIVRPLTEGQYAESRSKLIWPESTPSPTWPTQLKDQLTVSDYPPFRTATSIHTPPYHDITKPWFELPSYFHSVIPHLNFQHSREEIIVNGGFPQYPLGDLHPNYEALARFSTQLLTPVPGTYKFQLVTQVPTRLGSGESSTTHEPEFTDPKSPPPPAIIELTVETQSPTTPLTIILSSMKGQPHPGLHLLWKRPGDSEFTPVPAHAFTHPVNSERQSALAAVTDQHANRKLTLNPSLDDAPAVQLITTLKDPATDPASLPGINSQQGFFDQASLLRDAFTSGKSLAGSSDAAHGLFTLIHHRLDFLRKNPDQLSQGGFTKTDGRTMRLALSLQSLLHGCENHPALQQAALTARADLASYIHSTCLNRSFFSEVHHGANDGYGDDGNLLVNFWRAASVLDDPYAWDAATLLQDSHFRYASGRGDGLSSDGIFLFHNANGRHVHIDGYGMNWFGRVVSGGRHGTPWSYTPEQYRRLTELILAYEWLIYHNTQPFVANGRHNEHAGSTAKIADYANRILNQGKELLRPEDKTALQALLTRIKKNPQISINGNRFFYRSLLAVHRRPDYYIDVKMTAPLVGGPESFAGHYPWNMSFGDGVTTLMRSSNEFTKIHRNSPNAAYASIRGNNYHPNNSLWFYRQLPGTTQLDDELFWPDRYRGGQGSAAGGVSDGQLGHCAFHFKNHQSGGNAKKFYAFTEDGMAQLITGISKHRDKKAPDDVTLRTTLNQCDATTDVTLIDQNGFTKTFPLDGEDVNIDLPLDRRYWITHGGIGYLLLPTGHEAGPGKVGTLKLSFAMRNLLTLPPGEPIAAPQLEKLKSTPVATERATKIFNLAIDHTPEAKDARAAYFVCMRADQVSAENAQEWLKSPPIEILSNTPKIQATRDTRDGTTNAFFHLAGTLEDSDKQPLITAATPLAVMWRPATGKTTLQDATAACLDDPSKMPDTLSATLFPALQGIDEETTITSPAPGQNDPTDRYRGRPVTP